MKQLRTIKKKSVNLVRASDQAVSLVAKSEQTAKDILMELSDALPEAPHLDPFLLDAAAQPDEQSPVSKKTLAHANTFTEYHSTSLRREIQGSPEGRKHKFLLRKKESVGAHTPYRQQRRINYIEYSYSPKRSMKIPDELIEPRYQELRGSTVYVAKVRPQPEVKFSKFIMCEELPPDLSNPKVWNDLKRVTKDSYGKSTLSSSQKRPTRGLFEVDQEDSEAPYNSSQRWFSNELIESKLSMFGVNRISSPTRPKVRGQGSRNCQ